MSSGKPQGTESRWVTYREIHFSSVEGEGAGEKYSKRRCRAIPKEAIVLKSKYEVWLLANVGRSAPF